MNKKSAAERKKTSRKLNGDWRSGASRLKHPCVCGCGQTGTRRVPFGAADRLAEFMRATALNAGARARLEALRDSAALRGKKTDCRVAETHFF
jgi:hypothetical protein